MNAFLLQIVVLFLNDTGEDTFWMQMLVLVVLGVLVGLGYLIKTRPGPYKDRRQYHFARTPPPIGQLRRPFKYLKGLTNKSVGFLTKTANQKVAAEKNISAFGTADAADRQKLKRPLGKEAQKDLAAGMELLELDFLLSVVENINGDDEKDVMIRRLSFNELLRRKKLDEVSSSALKVYTIDKGNLYGKEIQCGAMKELSQRTPSSSKT